MGQSSRRRSEQFIRATLLGSRDGFWIGIREIEAVDGELFEQPVEAKKIGGNTKRLLSLPADDTLGFRVHSARRLSEKQVPAIFKVTGLTMLRAVKA